MFPFGKFSGEGTLPFRVERSTRCALSLVAGLFRSGAAGKPERQAMLSMIREVLAAAGAREAAGREALRQMLSRDFSPSEAEKIVAEMRSSAKLAPEEAAERIAPLPEEERERLLQSLIALATASEALDSCRAMLITFTEGVGFSKELFDKLATEAETEYRRRQRFLRSGAGILVALIVIGVFILTATLLKSVIFGLIAAYVFLPVEKFFERRLRAERGLGHCFFRFTGWLSSPLHRLARSIRRRRGTELTLTPEESKRRAEGDHHQAGGM